jgi:hypothetical protein
MKEESTLTEQALSSLPCSTIVYRAILKNSWINQDTRKVDASAYILRPEETGLSVRIAELCPPDKCAEKFKRCRTVVSLHVGKIRDIGLDVIADGADHASIERLPSNDPAKAERLAGLLAEQSRIAWEKH